MKFHKFYLFSALVFLASSASALAVEVGQTGPCVELDDLQTNGQTINQCVRTRSNHQEFVLLEFFSATCGDCTENLPILSKLASEIDKTTQVRMIAVDRDLSIVHAFIGSHHEFIQYPIALDNEREAKRAYDVVETPTTFILDSKNKVIFKHAGVYTEAELAQIKALVSGNH